MGSKSMNSKTNPLPNANCELWYDGCVVCPTSELKDFREDDTLCNIETCDLDLRKKPYCAQEYEEGSHMVTDPKQGVHFCSDSPKQMCRRMCAFSEYPTCEGVNFCVMRIGNCCEFECVLDKDAVIQPKAEPTSGSAIANYAVIWVPLTLIVLALLVVGRMRQKAKFENQASSGYEKLNPK